MKHILGVIILSLLGTQTDLAADANGNGPCAPITPYTIWMAQSQHGKPYTPIDELIAKARPSTPSAQSKTSIR